MAFQWNDWVSGSFQVHELVTARDHHCFRRGERNFYENISLFKAFERSFSVRFLCSVKFFTEIVQSKTKRFCWNFAARICKEIWPRTTKNKYELNAVQLQNQQKSTKINYKTSFFLPTLWSSLCSQPKPISPKERNEQSKNYFFIALQVRRVQVYKFDGPTPDFPVQRGLGCRVGLQG